MLSQLAIGPLSQPAIIPSHHLVRLPATYPALIHVDAFQSDI